MIESIVAGVLQGVFEWIPVSSEGIVSFVLRNYFGRTFNEAFNISIFLHLGTVLSSIYYFRNDIKKIWTTQTAQDFRFTSFIFLATLLSFLVAGPLYLIISIFETEIGFGSFLIGSMLIITGLIQVFGKKLGKREYQDIRIKDAWLPGVLQGFSIIPGISRSGVTLFGMLTNGFNVEAGFKASFLMAIPVVIIADIFLGVVNNFFFRPEYLLGAAVSFFVGLFSIKALLSVSKKYNFGVICIILGLLSIIIG